MKAALMTLFLSMVPVIELRGAIPFGVLNGLSVSESFWISAIGNLIPIPVLVIFTRKVFEWLRTKNDTLNSMVCKFERKAEEKRGIVEKFEFVGLIILVAIPLPGTGAWTGALVAAMMDMRLKRAFPAIAIGVLIAGVIVSVITFGVGALI